MITEEIFESLKETIYQRLNDELPSHLEYHCAQHTHDVLKSAELIAEHEHVVGHDLLLLKIAVLYHDFGFVNTTLNHELEACALAEDDLPRLGLATDELIKVCEMIMATRIPQTPKEHLGQILCDADLDYLGTHLFEELGSRLYRELKHSNPNLTIERWSQMQISFLEKHHYFTEFSKKKRTPKKAENLRKLIAQSSS